MLLLGVYSLPGGALSSALPSVHETGDLPPHHNMEPMARGWAWRAPCGDLVKQGRAIWGHFPQLFGAHWAGWGKQQVMGMGWRTGEDAEPRRGCSSFPCTTVTGFCSSSRQGWGAGKHLLGKTSRLLGYWNGGHRKGSWGSPPLISHCNLINCPSAQTEKKVKTNLHTYSMLLSYFSAAMPKSGLREKQDIERERKSPFPF